MALKSDLNLDATLFAPSAISAQTNGFNEKLMEIMSKGPKWYEVGAEKYRKMRAAGETPLPAAVLLASAEEFLIPSRSPGREINCRLLSPQGVRPGSATGVFLHIHGGGWVLQDEKSQDPMLQSIANSTGLVCFSVGYRLAPEHPFPAGPDDCYDAAEWLIDNAEQHFGAPLSFIGGESAGGHLSALTALHLLQHQEQRYSEFRLKGLLLHFGAYDMTFTPQAYTFKKDVPLVLDLDLMQHYIDAFLPGMSFADKQSAEVSPLYANLYVLKLPPALFSCGTEDCLLDDTMFMSTKWMMAGGETVVKVVPGAAHGYIMFPEELYPVAGEGMESVRQFIRSKLGEGAAAGTGESQSEVMQDGGAPI